jgi:hypothetical protein
LSAFAGATLISSAELEAVSEQFLAAVESGDSEKLTQVYLEGPTREKTVAEFIRALPEIKSGKMKVARVDKELVIGNLGVTLLRTDFEGQDEPEYGPLVCVRTESGWRVFPWASESDLKVLFEQRTPDEQIHLKLFDLWGNLTEQQLKKEAEAGTGQSATRPESKSEGDDKPQPEADGRSR